VSGLPLWAAILAALGLPTIVTTVFLAIVKWRENKQDDDQSTRDRDSWWNASYRVLAEAHTDYDYYMLARLQRAEGNHPNPEPIPPRPPLFPKPRNTDD
jgi:hypothetical protein